MSLLHFEGVHNFRKATEKLPLYRSATWDFATDEQKKHIITETGITHRIDLRSELENLFSKSGKDKSTVTGTLALQMKPTDHLKVTRFKSPGHEQSSYQEVVSHAKKYIGDAVKYNVNFMDANYRDKVVWDRLSHKERLKLIWWLITFRTSKVKDYVNGKIIGPRGLFGMYTDFIDYSQEAISTVLFLATVIFEEGASGKSVLQISCREGKDRTGIIAALIKHIINDDNTSILEDYEISEKGLEDTVPSVVDRFVGDGLPADFAKTPRENMEKVWEYIIQKYGSIDGYLDKIGFTEGWRMRLGHFTQG